MTNFSGILDGYLARKAAVGRPAIARWRGSLLGACVRQQWYAAEKVEPSNPFPDNLYRIFERGHAVAEVLNKAGKDALEAGELLSFQEEVPVLLPEYDFSGNVDALVMSETAARTGKAARLADMLAVALQKVDSPLQVREFIFGSRLRDGWPHHAS